MITVAFIFTCSSVVAQNFPMLHYTIDNGLPSNTVYSVYRDSKGFLWIATPKGIARYNGISFQTFTTSDGLPDNEVFFFQEDKQGRLWLATYNGELCFYKDSRFHTAVNTRFLKLPFKNTFINKIAVEEDSSVTIMFDNQEKFINIAGSKIDIVDVNVPDVKGFFGMYKLRNGLYRFFYPDSTKDIDKFHKVINRKLVLYNFSNPDIPHGTAYSIAQDQRFIVRNNDVFNPQMERVKVINPRNKIDFHAPIIYFDKSEKFFLGTESGLYIDDSIHVIPDVKVTSITQDIERNYWVTTLFDGLYVIDNNYINFHLYNRAYEGNIRYSYADDNNLFYTNSENNLYRLKNNDITCLFDYVKFAKRWPVPPTNHGFLVTRQAPGDYDYFNFYENYIVFLKDILHEKRLLAESKPFKEGESVKSIIDAKGNFLVRTIDKIYTKPIDGFAANAPLGEQNAKLVTTVGRIFAFARSLNSDIWLSTVNGVYKIHDTVCAIQPQFGEVTFKKFEFLGNYLVGYTANNRLVVCRNVDDNIKMDTVFSQNCIWDKFYPVDSAHMLISTNDVYRLFTINPPNSATLFSVTGIENPILPLGAEWFSSDGKNCFFFNKGDIVEMGIDNLLSKTKPPTLFFDLITYGNRRYVMYDYLKVPYQGGKNISISFSTLSFTGKTISYRYSVSSTDEDNWLDLTGDNIDLINPKYGRYIIKIKAKSVSSANSMPLEFVLDITPPFWATWWFITFYICVAIAIVVLIVRYRFLLAFRKNQKENDNKIRFMKSEYKALNALMNPHFIFNTLNNVQGLVNRNDKLAANEYLRIFADLIRQNMHNVSKELISLQKEVDLVTNYLALEKLRFKEMLNYSINVDEDVDTTEIMIPPLFIQPLVENSIKHGIFPKQSENSRVELNIYEVRDVLHIEVRDNGIGLAHAKKKADTKHESFGLNNIKVRIEQLSIILGKKIDFEIKEIVDERGNWTIVLITMSL